MTCRYARFAPPTINALKAPTALDLGAVRAAMRTRAREHEGDGRMPLAQSHGQADFKGRILGKWLVLARSLWRDRT
ncbi:MAG: hypothetical protein HYR63_10890 [Proteobacteria bacterium]|nr:hypothetical protein [Pseudomonadota bacterium]MBI3498271.1 hypothetical protein [Pseudomonadota bacterium]